MAGSHLSTMIEETGMRNTRQQKDTHLDKMYRDDVAEIGHTSLGDCQNCRQHVSHENLVFSLVPEHSPVFVVVER